MEIYTKYWKTQSFKLAFDEIAETADTRIKCLFEIQKELAGQDYQV